MKPLPRQVSLPVLFFLISASLSLADEKAHKVCLLLLVYSTKSDGPRKSLCFQAQRPNYLSGGLCSTGDLSNIRLMYAVLLVKLNIATIRALVFTLHVSLRQELEASLPVGIF